MSTCKVLYTGPSEGPFSKAFRIKGVELTAGAECVVPAVVAGALKRSGVLPPGAKVEIKSGTPIDEPLLPAGLKAQVRAIVDRADRYVAAPAQALIGLPVLSAEAKAIMSAKDGAAQVAAGKADAELGPLAIASAMMGASAVAEACVERSLAVLKASVR